VVVLLLPLFLAMEDGDFNRGGGGGSGGGPVAAVVAAVAAVDNSVWWWWHLMVVAAFGGGHATTSWRSERAAQQENKRAVQAEASQQPANLWPCCHFDMRHCRLSRRHGVIWHPCLPCRHGNTQHCLPPRGDGNGKEYGDGDSNGGGT
jgi:hypothetical protein